jgi:hypothetical protein
MAKQSGLTLRQHQREEIGLRADFVVAEKHRSQVRFSSASSAPEPHVTTGRALDVSSGGMGIACPQFLPRMCEGRVRVYGPQPIGTAHDGSPIHEVIFEHDVKVRRVTMRSHEPSYALGLAFIDPAPDIDARVQEMLLLVNRRKAGARPDG